MIAEIDPALRAKGISVPAADCPAERVQIERDDSAIVLSIVDADQRHTTRRVADPATAAALIESFLVESEPPQERMVEAASPRISEPPRTAARDAELPEQLAASVSPPSVRGALAIATETSVASDRSLWVGARASACVKLGAVCVGGITRFERDTVVSGDAETGEATRWGTDVLIVANLPIIVNRVTVTPGLGVGVGWMHVRRDFMSDTVEADAGGLRADAHVSASIPLGRLVQLRLGAAVDLAPNAHTRPFREEGGNDAPGEPRAFARFELGLEIAR